MSNRRFNDLQEHYKSLIDLFKWITGVAGAVGTAFVALIIWMTYSSSQEMKGSFEKKSLEMTEKLDNSYRKFNEGIDAMNNTSLQYRKDLKTQTDSDIEEFKSQSITEIEKTRRSAIGAAELSVKETFKREELSKQIDKLATEKIDTIIDRRMQYRFHEEVKFWFKFMKSPLPNALTQALQVLHPMALSFTDREIDLAIQFYHDSTDNSDINIYYIALAAMSRNPKAIDFAGTEAVKLTKAGTGENGIGIMQTILPYLSEDYYIRKVVENSPNKVEALMSFIHQAVNSNPSLLVSILNDKKLIDIASSASPEIFIQKRNEFTHMMTDPKIIPIIKNSYYISR